jgi:hypothetical protein
MSRTHPKSAVRHTSLPARSTRHEPGLIKADLPAEITESPTASRRQRPVAKAFDERARKTMARLRAKEQQWSRTCRYDSALEFRCRDLLLMMARPRWPPISLVPKIYTREGMRNVRTAKLRLDSLGYIQAFTSCTLSSPSSCYQPETLGAIEKPRTGLEISSSSQLLFLIRRRWPGWPVICQQHCGIDNGKRTRT